MLGGTSKWDIIGSRPAGDLSNLKSFVRAVGRKGIPLIFLEPGGKEPIDLRSMQMQNTDDDDAQKKAKAAGNPRWAEVRTRAGIQLATTNVKRLERYADRAAKIYSNSVPNLATVAGDGLLVIDADHAEGVKAFCAAYKAATGKDISPTVLTPGVQNPDGTWKHKGGGHFYLQLPEGYTLPDSVRSFSVGEGKFQWSIFPLDHYILIPPSVRPEGPYRWVGTVHEAPALLLEVIETDAKNRAEAMARRAERAANRSGPTGIDAWAAATDWSSLLEPDGWFVTGCRTACGCPEVTAPGVHASPKSATAHEPGCLETDTSSGHGPLHVWTDNPPPGIAGYTKATGSSTLTKLQYFAWTHHGGNEAAAIKALGIIGGTPIPGTSTAELNAELAAANRCDGKGGSAVGPNDTPTPSTTLDGPPTPPSGGAPIGSGIASPGGSGGSSPSSDSFAKASTGPFKKTQGTSSSPPPPPPNSSGFDEEEFDEASDDDDDRVPPPDDLDEDTREVQEKLPPNRRFEPYDKALYPAGFHSTTDLLRKIFDYSDVTRTIFHAARDRRPRQVHPMALLAHELLRRGTRCPVNLRLWAGTPPSTFVVIAGRSGLGKSESAKPDASPWPNLKAPTFLANAAARKVTLSPEDMTTYQARMSMASAQWGAQPFPTTPQGYVSSGSGPVNSGSGNSGSGNSGSGNSGSGIASPSSPVLIPYDFDSTTSLGSGQVLSDHLIEIIGKGDDIVVQMAPHPCAFIAEDEMTTMLRAAKGDTSTIISTLNTAWAGMPVGNKTRMHGDRRTNDSYSVFITAGLQPKLCHELFCHDDSGFLQRFVFVATADPYALVNKPGIPVPTVKPSGAMPMIAPGSTFTADPKVISEVEDPGVDYQLDHLYDDYAEMMSHASQVRIRLACLGALLHGTLHISWELWEWAGWIMEHSRRVFAWMEGQAKEKDRQQAEKDGEYHAERTVASEGTTNQKTKETCILILKHLDNSPEGKISKRRLFQKLAKGKQGWLDRAITLLLGNGTIYLDGIYYRRVEKMAKGG